MGITHLSPQFVWGLTGYSVQTTRMVRALRSPTMNTNPRPLALVPSFATAPIASTGSATPQPANLSSAWPPSGARTRTGAIKKSGRTSIIWSAAIGLFALFGAGQAAAQTSYEAENLSYSASGATASVQTDTNSSNGHWIQLAATGAGPSITFTLPTIAAGTYQLQMEWKGNNNRGILTLAVDGTQLGSSLDQYASGQTYPTTTFGNVTFSSSATHTIKLTATGKNSSSSNYYLSADRFILTAQTITRTAAPTFTPSGGTYSTTQSVSISSATTGASIRYTTDGSTPTSSTGTLYSGPVTIAATTTLNAIAYASGLSDSTVTSETYTISATTTTVSLEAENLSYSASGATASVQTDTNSSNGQWIQLAATGAGPSITFTTPSIAAGTYSLQMEWKGNGNRGILTLAVDGSQVGGSLDQYSAAQSYPTTTFGNVTFASAATHTIKLTATGKNASSSNYYLSADKFVFGGSGSGGSGTPNGNPILPPKWAFGVLFGSYDNQTNVLNDMTKLRQGFCGDLIWVDSSWLSSDYNGPASAYIDFKFDSSQFSDPAGMISTLHSNHFHFGVWEWPWIDVSNSLYNTGKNNHYFIENSSGSVVNGGGWHGVTFTGQFDLSTSPSVTWWKSLNKPLFDMGFDFLKMDTTVGIPSGGVLKNGSTSGADWRGFYRKAAYEATTTANLSQGRGLILAHSDAGSATNGDQYPGVWTGDSSASFSSLVSKDMGGAFKCNTKATGAYWCGDIGGYNNNSNDELYQRWLEYGCFNPLTEFFGAKGTTGSNSNLGRFPWCFSSAAQATFTKFTQLRYQLLPFRYSNAQACYHVTGGAVQYPVWWPNSTQIINGHGASQILVQPITTSGATSASVAIPSGASWINYWTGATYAGGTTQTISAAVNSVPMLVRAGSIIPMYVNYDSSGNALAQQYVNPLVEDPLTLDIYPAGSTSYTYYEDDGASDLYVSGDFSTTTFASNNTSGHEVVTIGAAAGDFAGKLATHNYYLKIHQSTAPTSVTRDGTALTEYSTRGGLESAATGWFYDATAKLVWVKFALSTSASTTVSL
jgi:hypothetical protein